MLAASAHDNIENSRPADLTGDPAQAVPLLAAYISIGKRLPDALYLHVDAVRRLDEAAARMIERVREQAAIEPGSFNVVKLGTLAARLSFLHYANFFDDPFPALTRAWTIDLCTRAVQQRSYSAHRNPPILHRKETLLPPDDPRAATFRALTAALELQGIYDEAAAIGTRRAWDERLHARGFRVVNHELVAVEHVTAMSDRALIERHRTAIERTVLSTPMQHLWRNGYLDGRFTVFDYGCGRGGDLRALRELGLEAKGWDPYFAPSETQCEADLVNLGFVLNVVESPSERRTALECAYALSRRLLVVAVMIGGTAATERFQRFGDGVLTQRNTFQKYFTQDEARAYIETILGREPVACGPGVFFVFRSDEEEQAFLASRYASAPRVQSPTVPVSRCAEPGPMPRRPPSTRGRLKPDRELLDALWHAALSLGRSPQPEDFARFDELRRFGKPERLLDNMLIERGRTEFDEAKDRRRGDLLVFLAMNQFEGRRSRGKHSDTLKHDLRAFFGRFDDAENAARTVLFSIANAKDVRAAAREASNKGLGHLDAEHSLQLESRVIVRLPPLLRVFAGCAARLYGDLDAADMVKLHLGSGKVTLLFYDDLHGKPLPLLLERIKINLRTQAIEFFRYGDAFPPQPLYRKSLYLAPDAPQVEQQRAFDQAVADADLVDKEGFGPSAADFNARLRQRGFEIADFRLTRTVK